MTEAHSASVKNKQRIVYIKICAALVLLALGGFALSLALQPRHDPPAISFYHWKTAYNLGPDEKALLSAVAAPRLFVRFFDVALSPDGALSPLATAVFRQPPELPVVPVVFIDNEALRGAETVFALGAGTPTKESFLIFGDTGNGLPMRSLELEWCRSFYAGSLYRLGQLSKAFVQLCKTAVSSPQYSRSALTAASWCLEKATNTTCIDTIASHALKENPDFVPTQWAAPFITDAKTRSEVLLVLAFLESYSKYGFDIFFPENSSFFKLLEEIRDGAPVPAGIDRMLLRFMRSMEQKHLRQIAYSSSRLTPWRRPHAYIDAIPVPGDPQKGFTPDPMLERMDNLIEAVRDKMQNTALWGTAFAYCALLSGKRDQLATRIAWAEKQSPSIFRKRQLEVFAFLDAAFHAPLTEVAEKEFLRLFSQLPQPAAPDETETAREAVAPETARAIRLAANILHYVFAPRNLDAGRTDKAVYCVAAARALKNFANNGDYNYYYTVSPLKFLDILPSADVERTAKFPLTAQTPFERFLAASGAPAMPDEDGWRKIRVTYLLRQKNFAKVAETLERNSISSLYTEIGEDLFHMPYLAFDLQGAKDSGYMRNRGVLDAFALEPTQFAESLQVPAKRAIDVTLNMDLVPAGTMPKGTTKYATIRIARGSQLTQQDFEKIVLAAQYCPSSIMDFTQCMLALQHIAEHFGGEAGAAAAYTAGLGEYSMTYFGNGREMTGSPAMGADSWAYLNALYNNSLPESSCHAAESAQKLFLDAEKRSSNPELKAKALFMAQARKPAAPRFSEKLRGPYFTENPFFEKLIRNHANTEYYKAARDACTYLRDFTIARKATLDDNKKTDN